MNSEVGCSRCTAVAALQLVGEDRLALDSPITSIVDLGGTTISAEVTLWHLLTHTSGLADDADEEAGEDYETLWVDKPVYSVIETRDFLPQFAYKPALFAPGCDVGTATWDTSSLIWPYKRSPGRRTGNTYATPSSRQPE